MDIPKCSCGKEGRYQNVVNGEFIWTCEKKGCLNPPKSEATSPMPPRKNYNYDLGA
jgi:hypothetical protein